MNLRERKQALLAEASKLAKSAEDAGREFTAAEIARIGQIKSEVASLNEQLGKADAASATIASLAKLEPGDDGYGGGKSAPVGSPWARTVVDRMAKTADGLGLKNLLAGETTTPSTVEVVDLPAIPTRLLDLVPRVDLAENTFAYLRQVSRAEDVGVVPDHGLKPTSVYKFEEVEDRARVVAHLSEPIPIRYAQDHASMVEQLDVQMRAGVLRKLEQQVVHGDGDGENFTGILATTGVTAVEFAGDSLVTIRKARTALEVIGENPTAWVMHPSDIEAIELRRELADDEGGFLMSTGAYEAVFGRGVARVPSTAVPQGTALLADWRTLRVRVREGSHTLAATQASYTVGDEVRNLFDRNEFRLRGEGRFGVDIRRPQAIAVVALTAGGS